VIHAVFFDAFGTLCEIADKRNPYKAILKAWPSGVADARHTLMTQDRLPADLAREAGCSEETAQKIEAGIAAEAASMRLFPEVPNLRDRSHLRGQRRADGPKRGARKGKRTYNHRRKSCAVWSG